MRSASPATIPDAILKARLDNQAVVLQLQRVEHDHQAQWVVVWPKQLSQSLEINPSAVAALSL